MRPAVGPLVAILPGDRRNTAGSAAPEKDLPGNLRGVGDRSF